MSERTFDQCRFLIVEDDYLLADELRTELQDAGAIVVCMAGSLTEALAFLDGGAPIDGAILDVDIGGQPVFPIADRLTERGAPFLFATGYDAPAIPPRFSKITRCEKPFDLRIVLRAIGRLMNA